MKIECVAIETVKQRRPARGQMVLGKEGEMGLSIMDEESGVVMASVGLGGSG